MYNIGVVLSCAKCSEDLISGPDMDHTAVVKMNFKDGTIDYICPFCNHVNQMKFVSDSRMKETRRLPTSQSFRG